MIKTLQFESNITDIQKVNPLFSSCKIKVMYTGVNRNNSDISQDVVEKALPTIYNIPIVGEFIESKEDFGGHGGKIEISDQGIKFVKTTMPYGVVPESAQIYWEDIEENDGTMNKYLVVDGAYLWTGRYPESQKVIEEGRSQSMEIDVVDGELNKNKVYEIKDMIFSSLCILGEEVEPCFQSADITAYSMDNFKNEFKQMIAELKFSLQTEDENKINNHAIEGGNEMSENKKDIVTDFTLTSEQLKIELRRELSKSVTQDDWGYAYQDYYFVDSIPDQSLVIAKDWDDNSLVGFSYTVEGDSIVVDFATEKRFKIEYVPMDVPEDGLEFNLITKEQMEYKLKVQEKETESKVNTDFEVKVSEFETKINEFESKVSEKETELNDLQSQFEVIKQEKEELETFKLGKLKSEKEVEINTVFESVSSELTEDELAPFKEKAFEMEIDSLKKELYALIGQKAFEAKTKFSTNKNNSISIALDTNLEDTKIANSYDSIIKKYNNK